MSISSAGDILPPPEIRRPEAIDAAWLTAVLRQGGVDAVVDRLEARPIGAGQIGDSVRFSLGYAHAPDL